MSLTPDGIPADAFEAEDYLPPLEEEEAAAVVIDVADSNKKKEIGDMDYEERIEFLRKAVLCHPGHREILYKTLKYCCERHLLNDVEEYIADCPEFKSANQTPYHLLMFMVDGGGVELLELGHDGEVILPEQTEGLTEDEIDDLIDDFAFETNEYGRDLVEQMSPKRRILDLLEITPEFYDSFIEVMEFLTEKHSLADVDRLLRGRDVLKVGVEPGTPLIQPSVFVDKLEKAGGIYWKDGWIITNEGQEVLETLLKRRGDQ